MQFDGGPPPKRDPKARKGKGKKRLSPEDVQEDNPQLAEFLRQRRRAEARMADTGEIDFYLCLVFQSHKQREEFLDNLPESVSVFSNIYIDGEAMAQALDIKITPNELGPMQSPLNKKLVSRAGIPDNGANGNDYWQDEGFG